MVIHDNYAWKKQVPFGNVAYKNAKRYALRLNTIERELMNGEIDYYRANFSLEQVMSVFSNIKTDETRETFIKAVLKRSDNIRYLPDCMMQYYRNKIKKEFSEFRAFFEILLNKANKKNDRNNLDILYKPLLGLYYKPIMSKIKKFASRESIRTYNQKVKPDAYEVLSRDYFQKLKSDIVVGTIFGTSAVVGRLPVSVVDDYGNGEWVSKTVSYATDKFFLYSNKKSLIDDQIAHQVLANVYPGKGHFYNRILGNKPNICFDSGASVLIEGWADYASCHSKSMAYSYSKFYEKCYVAKLMLKKRLKKSYEDIWVYLMGRYPKNRALEIMVECTQYPTEYLSSVIGHIGIYEILKTDFAVGPSDLLDVFSGVNIGDYLAVYHPKVQKKLMDTSITAKVSKRMD